MDHEKIGVLLEVAGTGSFQGAARRLGLSRSLLRRRIELLEAEVGVPLLHRDAVGVRLTSAGAIVVEEGRALLETSRALLARARAAHAEPAGAIRVLLPIGMPLTPQVQTLLATHGAAPTLRFVLREVDDPLKHLHEPCELVLHEGPLPDKSTWFSRVVRRLPLRVLASPSYLRARGTPQNPADLAGHDIVGWKRPGLAVDAWPLVDGGTVEVSPWVVSPGYLLVRTLASHGAGLLLAPQDPLVDEPEPEPMVAVLEGLVGSEIVFRASTPHLADSDARTRVVIEQIQRVLQAFPEE